MGMHSSRILQWPCREEGVRLAVSANGGVCLWGYLPGSVFPEEGVCPEGGVFPGGCLPRGGVFPGGEST